MAWAAVRSKVVVLLLLTFCLLLLPLWESVIVLCFVVCLFVCFVALCPKSTAMVIAGWSVHLTTLFPGQA